MSADVPGRRRFLFAGIIALICVVVIVMAYLITVWARGAGFYFQVKHGAVAGGRNGYVGKLLQYDPVLGYVGRSDASGGWLIALGDPVGAYHSADGLRVPVQNQKHPNSRKERHPRLLFLGDSFTYGQLVAAENAFAYKTAVKLGGESVNAGVPGYNLVQMTLKARQVVPKYKPDYVVVQYTPWLVERAVSEFAPSVYPVHVSVPYYSGSGEELAIQSPLFSPAFFSIPEAYQQSAPGISDRFSFISNFALPAFWKDDVNMAWVRVRQFFGLVKRPSSDYEAVVSRAYGDLNEIARENGAKLVIVAVGFSPDLQVPDYLFPGDAYRVDAHAELLARLPEKSRESYARHYWLWRGNPPQPVDAHPNEQAHEIIAEALAEKIRQIMPAE